MQTIQNNMVTVLHVLRGNDLDDEGGMINQLRAVKLEVMLASKKEEQNKKDWFEKMNSDRQMLENKITMVKDDIEHRLDHDIEKRLEKVEKWKTQMIAMAAGIGIGAGIGIAKLLDLIFTKH